MNSSEDRASSRATPKTLVPPAAVQPNVDPTANSKPPSNLLRWTLASFHTVLVLYLLFNTMGLVIYQEIVGSFALFIESNYTEDNSFPGSSTSESAEQARAQRDRYMRFGWLHRSLALLSLIAAVGLGIQTYMLCNGEWNCGALIRFLIIAAVILTLNLFMGWEVSRATAMVALIVLEMIVLCFEPVRAAL